MMGTVPLPASLRNILLTLLAVLASLGACAPFGHDAASAWAPPQSMTTAQAVLASLDRHVRVEPTARAPVAALRLHRDVIMIKVLGPEGLIDEFVLRDPAGQAGVAGGWQLWSHRVETPQGTSTWFLGTLDLAQHPNADFAIRIGDPATPYRSSGDDGPWRYRGFGHGGMRNVAGSNRISLNHGTRNLEGVAAWPVGTVIHGSSLEVASDFHLMLPPADSQEAVDVRYVQSFGRAFGLRRRIAATALVPNVAMQDSYLVMMPLNPGNVTHFQPAGAAAERVLSDGVQKPSVYPNPWNSGHANVHSAWQESRPRLVLTVTLELGQPLRATNGSVTPWGWNDYARYFFTDNPDYAKYYVLATSSAEDPAARSPRRLVPGVTYEAQSALRTVLAPLPAR
jgi:hypothetical protein